MEAEKRGGKVEHEKTRSVSWPSTVTPQAELEDPGLLEASKLLCLVALGSLAFPSSVALIAKEATDIVSQGLQG